MKGKRRQTCATATSMGRGSVTDAGARPGNVSVKITDGCSAGLPFDGVGLSCTYGLSVIC